jgi:nucleotidyltransferase/DNA polymerase involved in DNA repair
MIVEMPENTELKEEEERKEKEEKASKKIKNKKNTDEDNKQVSSLLEKLQSGYSTVMKQLADYKEQAAFRIGHLEGELSSQRKLLSDGQHEIHEKEKIIRKLKIELKKTRNNLEEEKTVLDRMNLWQRIWKKKE